MPGTSLDALAVSSDRIKERVCQHPLAGSHVWLVQQWMQVDDCAGSRRQVGKPGREAESQREDWVLGRSASALAAANQTRLTTCGLPSPCQF